MSYRIPFWRNKGQQMDLHVPCLEIYYIQPSFSWCIKNVIKKTVTILVDCHLTYLIGCKNNCQSLPCPRFNVFKLVNIYTVYTRHTQSNVINGFDLNGLLFTVTLNWILTTLMFALKMAIPKREAMHCLFALQRHMIS